jgi:transcriptional antiterminator RfaH
MLDQDGQVTPHWYVIHTHPKQEDRAEINLLAGQVETFAPKHKQRFYSRKSKGPTYRVKPLFPGYIFARFDIGNRLHDIQFTRGVHSVVSFGNTHVPVDDEIINIIQSRKTKEGFIVIGEELQHGDELVVVSGPFKGLTGIFERNSKEADRVMILLKTVSYQSHVMLDREFLVKL